MTIPNVHRETVAAADLDAQRHLASFAIMRMFEDARHRYLEGLAGAARDAELGVIFAESHVNYRSPVQEGEEVVVRCSIGDVRRSSFRVWFEMRAGERLAAEGHGILVGYDYAAGRAAPLADPLRSTLEAAAP